MANGLASAWPKRRDESAKIALRCIGVSWKDVVMTIFVPFRPKLAKKWPSKIVARGAMEHKTRKKKKMLERKKLGLDDPPSWKLRQYLHNP
mmetsp:Transcript_127180/g.368206  ORF Transcript_127180/g.368206 Transcript_127180/m.368206 type:complete len:91 (-) Transcript_127180:490-762(-)